MNVNGTNPDLHNDNLQEISTQGLARSKKRGRLTEEQGEEQNQRIEDLCSQAAVQVFSLFSQGTFEIPKDSLLLYVEAKKINPQHPKVLEIEGFLSRTSEEKQKIALRYAEIAETLVTASIEADESIAVGQGLSVNTRVNYIFARTSWPNHPEVVAFEAKYSKFFDLS